jgi:hypothetical protein
MKHDIDISRPTEGERVAVNRRVVGCLRFLHQSRSYQAMSAFNIGDTLSFTPEHGKIVVGMVTRLNHKTVTVCTKDSHHGRSAPSFLSRTADAEPAGRQQVDARQGERVMLHEVAGKSLHGR